MIIKNVRKLSNVELVKSLEDIKHNMQVIDSYLNKGVDPEYTYALNLIKRGTGFAGPTIGTIYPRGSTILYYDDGTIRIVPPLDEE